MLAPGKKNVFCRAIAESKQEASTLKCRSSFPPDRISHTTTVAHSTKESSSSPTRPPALQGQDEEALPLDKLQLITICALDFTPFDFSQHFDALWGSFQSKYDRTSTYWPSGCSQLAQRNEALDLALIALSAQRLAFSRGSDQRLTLLSLTAYDKALNLFIALMRQRRGEDAIDQSQSAMLAVISTVFSLLEGSQSTLEVILEHGWRWSKHLQGAMELLRQSGPEAFAVGGFHVVFKKIREMGVGET